MAASLLGPELGRWNDDFRGWIVALGPTQADASTWPTPDNSAESFAECPGVRDERANGRYGPTRKDFALICTWTSSVIIAAAPSFALASRRRCLRAACSRYGMAAH